MGWISSQLFFTKDGFGIEYHSKVDIPLNKETKIITWFQVFLYNQYLNIIRSLA